MEGYDANGAPVEGEKVRRYRMSIKDQPDSISLRPVEHATGSWVRASEHLAAVQRLERENERITEMAAKHECDLIAAKAQLAAAKRENERLDAIAKYWYKHPSAQAELGAKARLHIEIGLVDDLLKGEDDFSAMEMEYWTDTHDKLHALIKERDSLSTALAEAKRDLRHRDELDDFAKPLSCETHGLVPNLAAFDNKCPQCALAAERERGGRMERALRLVCDAHAPGITETDVYNRMLDVMPIARAALAPAGEGEKNG